MENYIVDRRTKIIDVIRQIEENSLQIVLVVDEEKKLLGTVTDGDIRRAILRGIDLHVTLIETIMHSNPYTARLGDSKEKILAVMHSRKVRQVPVIDREGRVVQLTTLDMLLETPAYPNIVMIMAGGLGTRLGELTKNCPKPLLSVGGKPVLETIIESFKTYGFTNFIMAVNYKSEMIEKHFKDGREYGVNISYLREKRRLGTAGALGLLQEKPQHPLIVINGDVLTKVNFEHFLNFHIAQGSSATMGVREYSIQVPYGVIEATGTALLEIREKPVHRHFISTGIYLLSPETLECIEQDEYLDMPVLFERLLQGKKHVAIFPVTEYWMDIGQMEDLEEARDRYKEVFQ